MKKDRITCNHRFVIITVTPVIWAVVITEHKGQLSTLKGKVDQRQVFVSDKVKFT